MSVAGTNIRSTNPPHQLSCVAEHIDMATLVHSAWAGWYYQTEVPKETDN